MSSHYSTAKSIQSESTRASYHTAPEPIEDTSVCAPAATTQRDTSSPDDAPSAPCLYDSRSSSTGSIKSVDRLRREGNSDPPSADSRQIVSLSSKLQEAVGAINDLGDAEASNSRYVPNQPSHVLDNGIFGPPLPLRDLNHEGSQYTAKDLPGDVEEGLSRVLQNLGLKTGSGRTTKDALWPKDQTELAQKTPANKAATKANASVDSAPREAADIQKYIARRQKKLPVSVDQRLEEVRYDCTKAEHERTSQDRILVNDPPQELSIEDLANDAEAVGQFLVLDGGVQISPEAPRSPALDRLVESQSSSARPYTPGRMWIPRSWGVTRERCRLGRARMLGSALALGVDWRPCTYEELTWIGMMERMRDFDTNLNDTLIGHNFREKFGWNLPEEWERLAGEIHKDERSFKRRYVGWQPVVVSWKGRRFGKVQK